MNERLRRALDEADVDIDDVARATGVNHRTVQRWLSGRVPYPRYRRAIAKLVRSDEADLWPGAASPSSGTATAEIVNAYARRADAPRELWWDLLEGATRNIDLLGYAMLHLFENHPRLAEVLRDKTLGGCIVRIALADPRSAFVWARDEEAGLGGTLAARIFATYHQVEPFRHTSGFEFRLHSVPMYNSVFRFDDDMLVTPHVYRRPGRVAPLLHLRRRQPDGIFDNYLTHFEDVFYAALPPAEPADEPLDEENDTWPDKGDDTWLDGVDDP